MIIKQLSVFLENETGTLYEATEILEENQINISALSLADSENYGVLRMILSDPEKALNAMKAKGLSVSETEVIGIITPDTPGSLSKVLRQLKADDINVAYMYGYSKDGVAPMILKVNDPEKAIDVLLKNEVQLVSASEFYK